MALLAAVTQSTSTFSPMDNSVSSVANVQAAISRASRQLAAKEATISYLRAELQRAERERIEWAQQARVQHGNDNSFDPSRSSGPRAVRPRVKAQNVQQTTVQPRETSTIRDYLRDWPAAARPSRRNRYAPQPTPSPSASRRAAPSMPQRDVHAYETLREQLDQERRARRQADARRWREVDEANDRRWREVDEASDRRWRAVARAHTRSHQYVDNMRDIYAGGMTRMAELYSEWQGRAHAAQNPVIQASVVPNVPVETCAVQEHPVLSEAIRELICVRVVGDALLPTGTELFPLISSFIVSINTPIDVAASRVSHHITEWLLANGAKPTFRTAHVAVLTGSLPMVQMIFHHLNLEFDGKEGVPSDVFADLPLANRPVTNDANQPIANNNVEIAEWILREYPTQMAREAVRVAAAHAEYLQTPLTWYAQRLQRHWKWEEEYAREIHLRKRTRASAGIE